MNATRRFRRRMVRGNGVFPSVGTLAALAAAPGEPAFHWRCDAKDTEITALGALAVVDADGPGRMERASALAAQLAGQVEDEGEVPGELPLLLGGFGFHDAPSAGPWSAFPALRFFLPRVVWVRQGAERFALLTHAVGREQTPLVLLEGTEAPLFYPMPREDSASRVRSEDETPGQWQARAARAIADIRAGVLDKLVLARRRTVPGRHDALEIARALGDARPSCTTFLVRWAGRAFVGSTPETLVSCREGLAEADALAGSAPRATTRAHDERLAAALVASAKEQAEHRVVVEAVREALASSGALLPGPAEPEVRSVPEAHHLWTRVQARLRPGANLLDVAARLHPTPATCGMPRRSAQARLEAEEPGRGWYAGGIAWMGRSGDGEVAVALRSALLAPGAAYAWAGAGLVPGSVPADELAETTRKLGAVGPFLERSGRVGEDDRGEHAA